MNVYAQHTEIILIVGKGLQIKKYFNSGQTKWKKTKKEKNLHSRLFYVVWSEMYI